MLKSDLNSQKHYKISKIKTPILWITQVTTYCRQPKDTVTVQTVHADIQLQYRLYLLIHNYSTDCTSWYTITVQTVHADIQLQYRLYKLIYNYSTDCTCWYTITVQTVQDDIQLQYRLYMLIYNYSTDRTSWYTFTTQKRTLWEEYRRLDITVSGTNIN